MNALDHMTYEEAAVLGALLLNEAQDEEMLKHLHCEPLPSEAAKCVAFAIRVLESKDLPVDVITVFEYVRDSESCAKRFPHVRSNVTLELLNSLAQVIEPREKVMAYLESVSTRVDELADEQDWI